MRIFLLPKGKAGIPQPHIHKVILCQSIDIPLPLDIKVQRLFDQEGVLQIAEIRRYCVCGALYFFVLAKVFESFNGFVDEPMEEARISVSALISTFPRRLLRLMISARSDSLKTYTT